MSDELDRLLGQDLLQPPADFSYCVMQGIKPLAMPFPASLPAAARPAPAPRTLLLRAGMVGAGLLGLSQVLSFVLSVWLATSAL